MAEICAYSQCKEGIDISKPRYEVRSGEIIYGFCSSGCRDMWALEERPGLYRTLSLRENGVIVPE